MVPWFSSKNVRILLSFNRVRRRKLTIVPSVTFEARPINTSAVIMASTKQLTLDSINPQVKVMEYAVRGPLVIRAVELQKEIDMGAKKPFANVIRANIGDAHAMGQQPITFIRQVISLCTYPSLMSSDAYPSDVKEKARRILKACGGGSVGAYTMSNGIELIRNDVAAYISRRDGGIAAVPDNIVLSGGASESIRNLMKLFICREPDGKLPGVMIPIPQYPLYSATVAEYGLQQVGYYLDEDNKWALSRNELQRAIEEAKKICRPRLLCVINPGNPTGQVLTRENIEEIVKFAHQNGLFLFADEVYQDNVYDPESKFFSFKKVLMEMGEPYSKMELASFHSISKGYMGECGLRGGYAEIINVDPDVMAIFKKSISAKLCSTVIGQAVMDCVVSPPKPGDPSYDLFAAEKKATLDSLAERAKSVKELYDSIPGISCNAVQGAMYAFPKIDIPQKAIDKAKSQNMEPDFFYAMQLLESSGICIIPGSGFGQKPGTYHFRTTILPQPALLKEMLDRFRSFHLKFLEEYK